MPCARTGIRLPLVSSGGSVDWLCIPGFDSPSICAAILDDQAGHWSIRPDTEFRVEREYVAGSMVLGDTDDPPEPGVYPFVSHVRSRARSPRHVPGQAIVRCRPESPRLR